MSMLSLRPPCLPHPATSALRFVGRGPPVLPFDFAPFLCQGKQGKKADALT